MPSRPEHQHVLVAPHAGFGAIVRAFVRHLRREGVSENDVRQPAVSVDAGYLLRVPAFNDARAMYVRVHGKPCAGVPRLCVLTGTSCRRFATSDRLDFPIAPPSA